MNLSQRIRRDRRQVTRLGVVPRQLVSLLHPEPRAGNHKRRDCGEGESRAKQSGNQNVEPGRADGGLAGLGAGDTPPDLSLKARRQRRGDARGAQKRS